jgi:hypothetical protein
VNKMAAEALIDTSRIGETLSSSASLTSQVMAMANAAPTAPISASALFAFGEGSSFVTRFYYSISLHSANKKGIALSAATAQGSCAHATTTTLQFMQQGECKSVAAHTNWVTKRNCSTVHIHDVIRNSEFAH